jgi:murein DD-endopeptidase MepM/ murein hydrolase activator NlpD
MRLSLFGISLFVGFCVGLSSEVIQFELKNPYEVNPKQLENKLEGFEERVGKKLVRFEEQDSPPPKVKEKSPLPQASKPIKPIPEATGSFDRPSLEKLLIQKHFSDNPVNPHRGLAIKVSDGKVVSSKDGKVIVVGNMEGYKNYLILEHENGFFTVYGNLEQISVAEGQHVKKGNYLGTVAKEKNLYFQMNLGGKAVDPSKYFN